MKGNSYTEGEPAGAAIVAVVGVHPCETCLAPTRELQKAVKTILKHGK